MQWITIKPEGAAEPPYRYTCSHCGSLWLTVEADRQPPDECKACGAKEEKTVKPTVCANCGYEMYFTDGTCHYCGATVRRKDDGDDG